MLNTLCCGLCTTFNVLSHEEMLAVDKALGNVKKSHKSITFTGLINIAKSKAVMLHYLAPTESSFCQVHSESANEKNKDIVV